MAGAPESSSLLYSLLLQDDDLFLTNASTDVAEFLTGFADHSPILAGFGDDEEKYTEMAVLGRHFLPDWEQSDGGVASVRKLSRITLDDLDPPTNPDSNPNVNLSHNPNPNLSRKPNTNPKLSCNLNPSSKPNLSYNPHLNPCPNSSANLSCNPNPNFSHNYNPNPNPILSHNHYLGHNPNHNTNSNLSCNHNSTPSPNLSCNHNSIPNPNLSPNTYPNLSYNPNPKPNLRANPNPNLKPNPNPNPNPNLRPYPNPNPNLRPNPNPSPSPDLMEVASRLLRRGPYNNNNNNNNNNSHGQCMQRSQSSHALGQLRPSEERERGLMPFTIGPATPFSPPQNLTSTMRRVYSTGDIQTLNTVQTCYTSTSPLSHEHLNSNEVGLPRIGHYTVEERRVKLIRYRRKKLERNYGRTIKYACRKTLADNRPRIKGRFAKSDDSLESLGDNTLEVDDKYQALNAIFEAKLIDFPYNQPYIHNI